MSPPTRQPPPRISGDESMAALREELGRIDRELGKVSVQRIPFLLGLLAFLLGAAWTLRLDFEALWSVMNTVPNPRNVTDLVFWSASSFLLLYGFVIIYRGRNRVVSLGDELLRRKAKLDRRLRQLSLEAALEGDEEARAQGPPASRPAPKPAQSASAPAPAASQLQRAAAAAGAAGREADRAELLAEIAELDRLSAETKECPMCAETVKARAKICRFCRHEFK